jgi:hypothetical protein
MAHYQIRFHYTLGFLTLRCHGRISATINFRGYPLSFKLAQIPNSQQLLLLIYCKTPPCPKWSRCICIPSSKPGIQLAFLYLHDCKVGHVKNEFGASCDKMVISPERKVVLTSGFHRCKLEKNRGLIFHLGCIVSEIFALKFQVLCAKNGIFLPFSLNVHLHS